MQPISMRDEQGLNIDRWLKESLQPFISSPHLNKANTWEVLSIVRESSSSDKSNVLNFIQDQAKKNKDWNFYLRDQLIERTGNILNVLYANDNAQTRLMCLVDLKNENENSDMYTKFTTFFENLNISEHLKTFNIVKKGSYADIIVPIIVDAIINFGQSTVPGSNLPGLDKSLLPEGEVHTLDSNQDISVDRSRFLVSYFTPTTSSTTTMSHTCTNVFPTLLHDPDQGQGQGQAKHFQSPTNKENIPDCKYRDLDIGRVIAAAVEKYNNYMTFSIKLNIFTESEINKFHDHAHKILTSPKVMSQFYPEQVDSYQNGIGKNLNNLKTGFIMENQKRMRERFEARRYIMSDVKIMYKELFVRNVCKPTAMQFTWKAYENKARKYSLSTSGWEKPLKTQLQQLHDILSKTNNSKPGIETETNQQVLTEIQKLEKCFKYESSATLIFNLTNSGLYGAVKIENNNKLDSLGQCLPFVASEGDKIIVGHPAQAINPHFDLMSLLEAGTKKQNPVSISSQIESLEVLWAMFFIELKNIIECKKNAYFSSCVLALSPCFSTTSKHILKTSLTLAGFTKSLLISTTTAITIPTAHEILRSSSSFTNYKYILVLHHYGSQRLDISLAQVGKNAVKVKAVGSIVQTQSTQKIREAISNVLKRTESPIHNLRTILCGDTESRYIREALSKPIAGTTFSMPQTGPSNYVLLGAHYYNQIQLASTFRIIEALPKLCKQHWTLNWFGWRYLSSNWCYSVNEEMDKNKAISIAVESVVGDREDNVIKVGDLKLAKSASVQITISSEGLLQFHLHNINPPHEKSTVKDIITIESKFIDSDQVELAKQKLSHYLQRSEFPLEEMWDAFLKGTKPTKITQGGDDKKYRGNEIEDATPLYESTNTGISIEENAKIDDSELTQAVAELKAYYDKVADVIGNGSHGISNQRILNMIKQDLKLCESFILQPIELNALPDLKIKFATLKVSTKALNID